MLDIISAFAEKHGILYGICDAAPLPPRDAKPAPFVSRNLTRRIDPAWHLPGVKNIIAIGLPYSPPEGGFLSSLACVPDYHTALKTRLQALAEKLRQVLPGGAALNYAITVDSSGLMERPFVVRAGLGFVGRNGMLISPEFGSFFNIGLLLIDALLPEDFVKKAEPSPVTGCKGCNLCVKTCPTGALRKRDFFSCLSYLTQKKGDAASFSDEEITLLKQGGQIYGCDICQNICPYNRSVPRTKPLAITPRDFADMTEAEFDSLFGHTAAGWRGLEVLRRNANWY